jgi:hypothetical protein
MRKSTRLFLCLGIQAILLLAVWSHSAYERTRNTGGLTERADMVKTLELTDLCLFTEARYTRHLSQADRHSPFQDHPLSFEHFPSGSLVGPPAVVRGW